MKAVFSDFYGTIVSEDSESSYEVVKRILNSGNADTLEEVIGYWWSDFRQRNALACGEAWRPQTELALETLYHVLDHFDSAEDAVELRDKMNEHWCNPPLFSDAHQFLQGIDLPVYFVTNSDDVYIQEALKVHEISCAGIITSEQAKYAKPQAEIFQYALDTLGLSADDVVHIGDSLQSDVACPSSLGIRTIWLNRGNKEVPEGVLSASSLDEALDIINDWSKL